MRQIGPMINRITQTPRNNDYLYNQKLQLNRSGKGKSWGWLWDRANLASKMKRSEMIISKLYEEKSRTYIWKYKGNCGKKQPQELKVVTAG